MSRFLFRLYLICPLAWSCVGFASVQESVANDGTCFPSVIVDIVHSYCVVDAHEINKSEFDHAAAEARLIPREGLYTILWSDYEGEKSSNLKRKMSIWKGNASVSQPPALVLEVPKMVYVEDHIFHCDPRGGMNLLRRIYLDTKRVAFNKQQYWLYDLTSKERIILLALRWTKQGRISFADDVGSAKERSAK